jgi:hypothetical protein
VGSASVHHAHAKILLLELLLISTSDAAGAAARLQRGGIQARTVNDVTGAATAAQVCCLDAKLRFCWAPATC